MVAKDEESGVEEFAVLFRSFLEDVVEQAPREEPPFASILGEHFDTKPNDLPVLADEFEPYDHPNLQLALDAYMAGEGRSAQLLGVLGGRKRYMPMGLSDLLGTDHGMKALGPGPVDYVNVEVEPGRTLACVDFGLYLITEGDLRMAVLVRGPTEYGAVERLTVEVMASSSEAGAGFLTELRGHLDRLNVYRGKVLSLERTLRGRLSLRVRHLPEVTREAVILPPGVLERMEAHTVVFSRQVDRLRQAGRHLKRGLLLHGPPGNGKTLSVTYLVGQMPDRTSILLTGRSMGAVEEAARLARTLQPSMLVLEDVDLIGMERDLPGMHGSPVLFELLSEMEGLSEDADVIFLLTSNRPDLLEPALALRPGRIDQAVELPLPDVEARRKLFHLFLGRLAEQLDLEGLIRDTDGVSAAFIRELARRADLIAAEADEPTGMSHLVEAFEELSVEGGRLTRIVLGADELTQS